MDKERNCYARKNQQALGRDLGIWGLAGAAVYQAMADLHGRDIFQTLDALYFFTSENCQALLERMLPLSSVDGDRWFTAAASWRRERGLFDD